MRRPCRRCRPAARVGILVREHERTLADHTGGQPAAERLPAGHEVLVLVGFETWVHVRR